MFRRRVCGAINTAISSRVPPTFSLSLPCLRSSTSVIAAAPPPHILRRNTTTAQRSLTFGINGSRRYTNTPVRYSTSTTDKMVADLKGYYEQVDALQDAFIERLRKAVAIPSVSAEPERRPDVVKMAEWLKSELEALGASVSFYLPGEQSPGLDLPPILLGRYGSDPAKRTILVYGHYDVQPAFKEDGWDSAPFELTVDKQGRMFGRGSTDDKGPVLGWLNVIEAHKKAGLELPVNLLMCFEGMEESGSEGLEELIKKEAKGFYKDTDAVCISDNYWLGTTKPCLTYGLRGCSYYALEVSGPGQDLHSGVYGGLVTEPMTDLTNLMSSLVDNKGKILIDGIYDQVAPLTDRERALYENIDFEISTLYEALGSETTVTTDKQEVLMKRWRFPSLSLHGVEGAYYAPGAKTVIPAKVVGKFSIRTVPNMALDEVTRLVKAHVEKAAKKLNTNNTVVVKLIHDGKWWVADPDHWNFRAAAKATKQVWGVEPDLTREGGSIPITLTFEEETGKNVLLLPMGTSTDQPHSINEKLDQKNYIQGTKLLGSYLHYVAEEKME
ncbi:Cys-Gly metallodipeptidase [Orbilia brochopaga]|uniref:Cys-Gly metallodipeptidase n=1 Tax=Orbilia brochopaga TaxID=3140254 RepID=A0AAV9U0J7_9PEZI